MSLRNLARVCKQYILARGSGTFWCEVTNRKRTVTYQDPTLSPFSVVHVSLFYNVSKVSEYIRMTESQWGLSSSSSTRDMK